MNNFCWIAPVTLHNWLVVREPSLSSLRTKVKTSFTLVFQSKVASTWALKWGSVLRIDFEFSKIGGPINFSRKIVNAVACSRWPTVINFAFLSEQNCSQDALSRSSATSIRDNQTHRGHILWYKTPSEAPVNIKHCSFKRPYQYKYHAWNFLFSCITLVWQKNIGISYIE